MAKVIPFDVRIQIIANIQNGQSYSEIAQNFGYSASGVKKIWYTYQKEGQSALYTKYSNCGSTSLYGEEVRSEVSKIRDNQQGASYVCSKMQQKHPELPCPSIRTLNRWWVKEQSNRSKGRPSRKEKKAGVKRLIKSGK